MTNHGETEDRPPEQELQDRSLLTEWIRRARINIDTHNNAEVRFSRLYEFTTALTLGGVVGLGQLATVATFNQASAKALVAGATILIAVISAVAVIWDWRSKAIEHRHAARGYAAVRRALEVVRELDPGTKEAELGRQEARRMWDFIASAAPNAPAKIREKARDRYNREHPPSGVT